jgi:RNA polymerase sigma factor (sigma-70 family)
MPTSNSLEVQSNCQNGHIYISILRPTVSKNKFLRSLISAKRDVLKRGNNTMTNYKSYLLWPGADDRIVVEEMLRDSTSGQWFECREFVQKYVEWKAGIIPRDQQDDLIQNIMFRIHKALPDFQFRCRLKTWLYNIIQNSIIDAHRTQKRIDQHMIFLGETREDEELEEEVPEAQTRLTTEENYIIQNDLRTALLALEEYIQTHANRERNRQILEMVLLKDKSLEEAANAIGCSPPVAGYVVRTAQRYVRERLGIVST